MGNHGRLSFHAVFLNGDINPIWYSMSHTRRCHSYEYFMWYRASEKQLQLAIAALTSVEKSLAQPPTISLFDTGLGKSLNFCSTLHHLQMSHSWTVRNASWNSPPSTPNPTVNWRGSRTEKTQQLKKVPHFYKEGTLLILAWDGKVS